MPVARGATKTAPASEFEDHGGDDVRLAGRLHDLPTSRVDVQEIGRSPGFSGGPMWGNWLWVKNRQPNLVSGNMDQNLRFP